VVLAAGPYLAVTLERAQVDALAERLFVEARVAADLLPWDSGSALDAACARLAADLGARITVIGEDGRVLGESARPSVRLGSYADRLEVREALATGRGRSARPSGTVGEPLLYVAVRASREESVRVFRLAVALTAVEASTVRLRRLVIGTSSVAALLGLGVALLASRRMLRRIRRLVRFARQLAAGDVPPYLGAERDDDLGILEAQLGEMARGVTATIAELRVEQERVEAILRSMVEGVVVTDLGGIVVLLNERARELLGVTGAADGRGRALVELTRDAAVQDLARALRAGRGSLTRDVVLAAGDGRTLQVNAAPLAGADGRVFGFVLVLHDVSELRRLEVVRRDFVANVSHELRTPLTAIKGYAETLLGPAGDDRETARRFLAIIDRHSPTICWRSRTSSSDAPRSGSRPSRSPRRSTTYCRCWARGRRAGRCTWRARFLPRRPRCGQTPTACARCSSTSLTTRSSTPRRAGPWSCAHAPPAATLLGGWRSPSRTPARAYPRRTSRASPSVSFASTGPAPAPSAARVSA
jgi:two-component system phosphate regulon sensor histidine kinase PhoR